GKPVPRRRTPHRPLHRSGGGAWSGALVGRAAWASADLMKQVNRCLQRVLVVGRDPNLSPEAVQAVKAEVVGGPFRKGLVSGLDALVTVRCCEDLNVGPLRRVRGHLPDLDEHRMVQAVLDLVDQNPTARGA